MKLTNKYFICTLLTTVVTFSIWILFCNFDKKEWLKLPLFLIASFALWALVQYVRDILADYIAADAELSTVIRTNSSEPEPVEEEEQPSFYTVKDVDYEKTVENTSVENSVDLTSLKYWEVQIQGSWILNSHDLSLAADGLKQELTTVIIPANLLERFKRKCNDRQVVIQGIIART